MFDSGTDEWRRYSEGHGLTIVATVKVHDGIVLGADSMTQIWGTDAKGNSGLVKAYDHAQKLFQVRDLPVGVMTYGIGNIGPRSIGSFIAEMSRVHVTGPLAPQEVAKKLADILSAAHKQAFGKLKPEQQPLLGVLLGGYSATSPLAEEWEFQLPAIPVPQPVRPPDQFGAAWRGVALPFNRLFMGFDPSIPQELAQAGLKQNVVDQVLKKFTTPVQFDGMPVQEAVDFAAFIVETTTNYAKFWVGAASCGGPMWIAAITRDGGFRWIKRHELQA